MTGFGFLFGSMWGSSSCSGDLFCQQCMVGRIISVSLGNQGNLRICESFLPKLTVSFMLEMP